MYITYKDKMLSIVKWRTGLQKLADEVKKELDDLCLNQIFGLHIPFNTLLMIGEIALEVIAGPKAKNFWKTREVYWLQCSEGQS